MEEKLSEDRELKGEHEAEHPSHHARFGLAFCDLCLKLRFHIGNLQVETVLGGLDPDDETVFDDSISVLTAATLTSRRCSLASISALVATCVSNRSAGAETCSDENPEACSLRIAAALTATILASSAPRSKRPARRVGGQFEIRNEWPRDFLGIYSSRAALQALPCGSQLQIRSRRLRHRVMKRRSHARVDFDLDIGCSG